MTKYVGVLLGVVGVLLIVIVILIVRGGELLLDLIVLKSNRLKVPKFS